MSLPVSGRPAVDRSQGLGVKTKLLASDTSLCFDTSGDEFNCDFFFLNFVLFNCNFNCDLNFVHILKTFKIRVLENYISAILPHWSLLRHI